MTKYKVECIFQMVISSEFRMGQYRDDDHRDYELHFIGEPQGKLVSYEPFPVRQKFDQAKANQETIWLNRLETGHLH